jgi:magnesium transporter
MDYYGDTTFFVMQSLNQQTLTKEEVNFFLGSNFIVTFHKNTSPEIDEVWERLCSSSSLEIWDTTHVLYHVLDKIVDNYFPIFYRIDDALNEIDENSRERSMETLLKSLFDTRRDLLTLRHTVAPMRDLSYRMINSQRLMMIEKKKEYFLDIHDHLLRLTEMIEEDREFTTDIRDSYLSLNSHETNRVMKVLTIITTIFMPLTFIAGLYGMNFEHMPELTWKYGYFITLTIMFIVGFGMFKWFQKKGWLK